MPRVNPLETLSARAFLAESGISAAALMSGYSARQRAALIALFRHGRHQRSHKGYCAPIGRSCSGQSVLKRATIAALARRGDVAVLELKPRHVTARLTDRGRERARAAIVQAAAGAASSARALGLIECAELIEQDEARRGHAVAETGQLPG